MFVVSTQNYRLQNNHKNICKRLEYHLIFEQVYKTQSRSEISESIHQQQQFLLFNQRLGTDLLVSKKLLLYIIL